MRLTVTVLHNVSQDMFWRYSLSTSRLFHGHDFQVTADNAEAAANLVWNLANIDSGNSLRQDFPHLSAYAAQVDEYRARRNRSLSMSDVLVIHERLDDGTQRFAAALSLEAIGHRSLGKVPPFETGSNDTKFSTSYQAHQLFHASHNERRN